MNSKLRWAVQGFVPRVIYKRILDLDAFDKEYINRDLGIHGQKAEDLVIDAFLGVRKNGFYVDVGANDPNINNNTKRFYDRGWSGINIEPNPIRADALRTARPKDTVLNLGASSIDGELRFHIFDVDALSTFNTEQAKVFSKTNQLVGTESIKVRKLSTILAEHADGQHIDFMSVDVEGYELDVIAGNDWKKYRPELLVMEINLDREKKIKAMQFHGYELAYYNGLNGFFIDRDVKSGEVRQCE